MVQECQFSWALPCLSDSSELFGADCVMQNIPNFKEILSLHISQEMKHSEGVKPIGGLVYMYQHVLWINLRYFSSSLKRKLKLLKTGIP